MQGLGLSNYSESTIVNFGGQRKASERHEIP